MAITFDSQDIARNGEQGHSESARRFVPPSRQARRDENFWRGKRIQRAKTDPKDAWKIFWKVRRPVDSLAQLCDAEISPLRWGLGDDSFSKPFQELLDSFDASVGRGHDRRPAAAESDQAAANVMSAWLESAQSSDMNLGFALSCLAAAWLLNASGGRLNRKLSWSAIDFLTHTVEEAQTWSSSPEPDVPPEAVVVEQILTGELPLTLSYLFSEMAPLHGLRDEARIRLSQSLGDLLNGEGLPEAANIGVFRPLAACWTRCRAIGRKLRKGSWSEDAEAQYQWLVTQAIRWRAPDGSSFLADSRGASCSPDFARLALRLGGSKKDRAAAKALASDSRGAAQSKGRRKTPATSDDSEWSGLAVMRSEWAKAANVVAIDYSTPEMRIEAWAGPRRLFNGIISAESRANGQLLNPTSSWANLCWFHDDDVDYLELRQDLAGGSRLERQILLAQDGFLLLADHLYHGESTRLEHQLELPLASDMRLEGESETRDALLVGEKPLARLIPLALPEWRLDPRGGELSAADGRIKLYQQSHGRAVACPLFIDLKPRRIAQASTWRQLTVAESLQIQRQDVAVGYRIQCGKRQWLYYRSLAPRGNRTLLGYNTSSEFLMARFVASKGAAKELIEIEG